MTAGSVVSERVSGRMTPHRFHASVILAGVVTTFLVISTAILIALLHPYANEKSDNAQSRTEAGMATRSAQRQPDKEAGADDTVKSQGALRENWNRVHRAVQRAMFCTLGAESNDYNTIHEELTTELTRLGRAFGDQHFLSRFAKVSLQSLRGRASAASEVSSTHNRLVTRYSESLVQLERGNVNIACKGFEECERTAMILGGHWEPLRAQALLQLSFAYVEAWHEESALHACERALPILDSLYGTDCPLVRAARLQRAVLQMAKSGSRSNQSASDAAYLASFGPLEFPNSLLNTSIAGLLVADGDRAIADKFCTNWVHSMPLEQASLSRLRAIYSMALVLVEGDELMSAESLANEMVDLEARLERNDSSSIDVAARRAGCLRLRWVIHDRNGNYIMADRDAVLAREVVRRAVIKVVRDARPTPGGYTGAIAPGNAQGAVTLAEEYLGANSPEYADAKLALGAVLAGRGRLDDAHKITSEVIEALRRASGKPSVKLGYALRLLAQIEGKRRDLDKALDLIDRALDLMNTAGETGPEIAYSLVMAAGWAIAVDDVERARGYCARAGNIAEQYAEKDPQFAAECYAHCAVTYAAVDESIKKSIYEDTFCRLVASLSVEDREECMGFLRKWALGRSVNAPRNYRIARLKFAQLAFERVYGSGDKRLVEVLGLLADGAERCGETRLAREWRENALEISKLR